MAAKRERIGAAHHEQRAVEHVVEIEDPGGRCIQYVALEDFDGYDEREHNDQPREGLARPVAEFVDDVNETSGVHGSKKHVLSDVEGRIRRVATEITYQPETDASDIAWQATES